MVPPLNILTLATLFPRAEAPNFGIFVERQTAGLAARGDVDVTVINPVGLPPWPLSLSRHYGPLRDLPPLEQWGGLPVHRVPFRIIPRFGGPLNPAAIARSVLPLARQLHRKRPFDLIDAEFFYPDGPAAMRLADELDLPFTIKARGADIHYWGHQRDCREQILSAAEGAAALLAVSNALKQDMEALGIDPGKIHVHYTGLDRERFAPRDRVQEKARLGIEGPLILSVGALIPRKRQALVIEALGRLTDATLILAGDGPDKDRLFALARSLGLESRVRFAGSVPHDELPALMVAADVMALPSASEGLANAWVESLACGTPIVICDVGGARELVESPHAGQIVLPDPDAIAGAIIALLSDPPAPDAVRDAVARFSWDRNAQELEAMFREAAGKTS